MRFLYSITAFLLCVILLSSCQKQESFSNIPAITFKSLTVKNANSAILEVNFTDGDGDIGYVGNPENAQPNFFIEYYRDSASIFVPMIFYVTAVPSIAEPSYTIPDVTPAGKNKSLTGTIKINMENLTQGLPIVGDTLQFNVWLFDRAGHKSNVLTTPQIIVP
jgi:hypothetical protein